MLQNPKIKKLLKLSGAILMLKIMLLVTVYSIGILYINTPGPLTENKIIVIEKGSSSWKITKQLAKENIIRHKYFFMLISLVMDKSFSFKAGEYEFEKEVKPKEIMTILTKGLIVIHRVTIPEGLTNRASIDFIDKQPALSGNINNNYAEGYLMGNTYFYVYGDRKQMILDQMYSQTTNFIDKEWEKRDKDLSIKSKEEAIILASIVEKEAVLKTEQPIIAGVFMNRLKKNMKLQADPTVEFAITSGQSKLDRLLTRNDWKLNSRYNTYFITGLPPTAIANPGKGAILAVLHPAKHDYLFFVANGNFGHNFSSTLKAHNDNFLKYKQKSKNG